MKRDATIAIATLNPDPVEFGEVLDRAEQADRRIEVIDMSPGREASDACRGRPLVRHHAFRESRGLSDSRNRALAVSETDRIVFLDSDAFPVGDWVSPLVRELEDDAKTGIAGARVLARWERPAPRLLRSAYAGYWFSLYDLGPDRLEVPRVIGTSFALDRSRTPESFDLTLGLRPGHRLGGEEIDYCIRARRMGLKVMYAPASVVEHKVPAGRASWRWILRRAYDKGREEGDRGAVEHLAVPLSLDDQLFRAAVAVPYVAGVLREPSGVRRLARRVGRLREHTA